MLSYFVGLCGVFILQDAVASIMFYPSEKWRWNHFARLVRALIGLFLIIAGAVL